MTYTKEEKARFLKNLKELLVTLSHDTEMFFTDCGLQNKQTGETVTQSLASVSAQFAKGLDEILEDYV